jgi:hypothetical protein
MGDAVAFDRSQRLLCRELLHDDDSAAALQCAHGEAKRRAMVQRRRGKIDRILCKTEIFANPIARGMRLADIGEQRLLDALWLSCRA